MYKAVFYVGGKRPGEMIPEGMLTEKRARELEEMGAIMKVHDAPVFYPDESFGEIDSDDSADVENHCDEPAEIECHAEEAEVEAPEIDLMDAIVEEDAPKEAPKRGRGSRSK